MIRHKEQMRSSFLQGRRTCFRYGKRAAVERALCNDSTASIGCIAFVGQACAIPFAQFMEMPISLSFVEDLQTMSFIKVSSSNAGGRIGTDLHVFLRP